MKIFLKILASVFLLILLLVVIVLFLPDQQYQIITKKLVENAIDRDVTIGELITTRGSTSTLEIKNFKISNASWANNPDMVSADNLFVSVDLHQLLEGKLRINDLSAEKLNIDLLNNTKGESNWHFKPKHVNTEKKFDEQILTRIVLSELNLSDTQLTYTDEQKKLKYRLQLPGFKLIKDKQKPDLQRINTKGSFNDLPFEINAEAGLIDSMIINKSLPFNLKSKLNESDLALNGKLVEQSGGLYLSANVIAQTRRLSDLSAFTVRELPPIGPITVSADINGNLKAISDTGINVNQLQMKVDDPAIQLDINGSLSELGAKNSGDVSIKLDVHELPKLMQLAGLKKELPGTLSLTASASGSGENFSLDISKAILDSEFLSARVSGRIEDLFNTRKAIIDVDANAANLNIVTQLFGRNMPSQWGPVTANATLTGEKGLYALTDIVAELKGASKLNASGAINNLTEFDDMQLDVNASLSTLNEISAFTPSPLPDVGPITANGKVNWHDGKLSLNDAKANYKGVYGEADVLGSIGDLIKFDIVRLNASAKVPDLGIAELFSGVEMPELKDIQASADLVSPTALDLSAKNFNASYDIDGVKVNAVGSIDSIIKNRAVLNLDVEAGLDSLASLNSLFKTSLPDFGPLSAKAKLTGAKKNIQLNDVDILLSDSALYGSLKGNLGKLADFKGVNLDVDLSTPALELLFKRLNLQNKTKKPASLVSHVNYEAGAFKFEKSELDIGGDKIIGDLSLLNFLDKESRPKITGNINVLNLNLLDLTENDPNKTKQQGTGKFLSTTPLPYEFIETTDLDLEFNIGRLRANIFDFTNSTVVVRSTDGLFKLGPFKGKLSEGDAAFHVDIDAKNKPTRTKLNVKIEGFNMAQAGAFRDAEQIESTGGAFLNFNLDAQGRTLASIMASANGGGALYFEDLLLKKGTLDLFTSDLFKKTLDAINPFKKKQKDTQISCAALAFRINDGLLTTPFGIAAEATEYSVTGNGKVDFKTEDIDLEFKTKVKKILAINPLEKLTGLVKVIGELTAPVITLNPKGIIEIGATVGAAIATGGLSLLAQDQLEKLNAKTELCSKALGRAAVITQGKQNDNSGTK